MTRKKGFSIIVTPQQVIKDGMQIKFERSSDFISYKEFVTYFSNLHVIEEHNLVIGINFTYGWMPTIFEFTSNEICYAVAFLNKVKKGEALTIEELSVLKSLFNNSLVGCSKLLHFINPKLYAIWDSRVFYYLTKQKPYNNRIGDSNSYLEYLDWIKTVIAHSDYPQMKNHIQQLVGYELSDCRAVELVLYSSGKNGIQNRT